MRRTGGTEVLTGADDYGLVMPLWLLAPLVLVGIGAQLHYLDRIALRTGRPPRSQP